MEETRAWNPLSPSMTASLLVHAAVFALLLPTTARVSAPEGRRLKGGAEVVEFGILQSTPEITVPKKVAAVKPVEQDDSVDAPKAEDATVASRQIGHVQGESGTGELGDPNGVAASARERYLYELTVLLNARKVYPMAAKRLGETGRIIVRFVVLRDGTVEQPEIRTPSLSERLNRAALQLIAGIGRFKPLPSEMIAVPSLAVEVPIEYVLN